MSTAPFRIHRPEPTGVKRVSDSDSGDDLRSYVGRLITLIPAEVVAIYITGRAFAIEWSTWWSLICLFLVIIARIWGTREPARAPQWIAVLVPAISFVIWVYAIGGSMANVTLPAPGIASIAVLVWTFLVPMFYKGD